MDVTETLNEGLKRGYTLKITGAELDAKVNEKLEEARGDIEIKGFRKGKAPIALLKKMYGEKVMGEAMQQAVDEAMSGHFEKSGDRPAQQPAMEMVDGENWKQGDDVELAIKYECLPDIPEPDFKSIKLEKMVIEADSKDVDESLENLAKNAQNFEPRKKGSKAKDGDQVVIDFKGMKDGEAFDGGTAEDYPLVLGSNSFIPGFEEQLVGLKAGEDKNVEVSFPEQYQVAELAGQPVVFEVSVKEVKEPKAAEIDDEMAKKFGAEDLEGLKTQISERLEVEYGQAARAVMKRKLLDELSDSVKFEVPPTLLENEAKAIAHQLWHNENPDVEGHDHPEIEVTDEANGLADRRVRLGLLLAEIGGKNEIKVSEQEMQQAVIAQARQYPGQEREFIEYIQKDQAAQQQISAPIYEDKVVDFILEIAEVKEKKVKKDVLEKAVKALEDL